MSFREDIRSLARLAAPVVVTQLALMSMGTVDTLFAGRLGATALAAVALGTTYSFGLLIMGMGVMMALDPLSSQATGAGKEREAGISLQRGLVVAALLTPLFSFAFLYVEPVLHRLQQPPEVVPLAAAFVRSQVVSIFPFLTYIALRQYLQGRGVVRPAMVVALLGNVINAALAWVCVFGAFGWEAMGVVGLGWSTSLCRVAMALLLVGLVIRTGDFHRLGLLPSRRALEVKPILAFLGLGIPIGLQVGFEVWVFNLSTLLAGWLGAASQAGHMIVLNLSSLSFMVPMGVASATSVLVGQAVGRGDILAAQRMSRVGLVSGLLVMSVSAVGFFLGRHGLARAYTPDPSVQAVAVSLLPIAATFQLFDGTQAVGSAVLRGVADTRAAMAINLLGYWILGLPFACYLAFRLHMGIEGIWWGLTLGLASVAVLLVIRIHRIVRPGGLRSLMDAPPHGAH